MPATAGPKRQLQQRYDLSHLAGLSRADRCIGFIEGLTSRTGPVKLRDFQKSIINDLFADPTISGNKVRQAYIQLARQQGKSQLAAFIALYVLVEEDHWTNPVVGLIANSERQAQELMRKILDVVESDQKLAACLTVYSDRIEYFAGGCRIQVFASSPAGAKGGGGRQIRGISARLMVVDELAFSPDPDLWYSVLMPTIMADPNAFMLAITTPGYDFEGPAFRMYERWQQGESGTDGFFATVFEAPSADPTDEAGWLDANPAAPEDLQLSDLRIAAKSVPPHIFVREHMGRWTETNESWLTHASWKDRAARRDPREIDPRTKVWLGFDGSYSGDSTALVGVTEDLYVFVIGCWEKPGQEGWRVPRDEVEATVESAMSRYNVQMLLCDPPYWQREIAEWTARWPKKVIEQPTHVRTRMARATTAFFAGVMEGTLTHDGDERMTRHIANCIVKHTPAGDVVTKENKDSRKKIDLAIAAVVAFEQAATNQKPARPPVCVV